MSSNVSLFEDNPPDGPGETSTDAYCTPPEACSCIHASVNGCSVEELAKVQDPRGVDLDPWTNERAIAAGWVRAKVAWTLASGRHPDKAIDPRPWPLRAGDYVHANPPYSNPGDRPGARRGSGYVGRFLEELERANAWGGLVLKTDNRTQWWRDIEAHSPFLVMWKGAMNFYHLGERIRGNNFASTILIVDHTGVSRGVRYDQLRRAYEGRAGVYR